MLFVDFILISEPQKTEKKRNWNFCVSFVVQESKLEFSFIKR